MCPGPASKTHEPSMQEPSCGFLFLLSLNHYPQLLGDDVRHVGDNEKVKEKRGMTHEKTGNKGSWNREV